MTLLQRMCFWREKGGYWKNSWEIYSSLMWNWWNRLTLISCGHTCCYDLYGICHIYFHQYKYDRTPKLHPPSDFLYSRISSLLGRAFVSPSSVYPVSISSTSLLSATKSTTPSTTPRLSAMLAHDHSQKWHDSPNWPIVVCYVARTNLSGGL